MEVINTYASVAQARIVQGMLESYGIHAELNIDANYMSVYMGSGATGAALLVPTADAARARELLQTHGDM